MLIWLKKNLKGDSILWGVVILLSLFSILVVYSASSWATTMHHRDTEYYLVKHSLLVMASLFAMWLVHNIDYNYFSKISRFLLILSVPLLVYTYFFGVTINGATRWIEIPFIGLTFQTSDLAKIALLTNLTSMLAKRQTVIDDLKITLRPVLIWIGSTCFLIAISDMGTAVLLLVTCMLVMFIGRVPIKQLSIIFGVGASVLTVAVLVGRRETVLHRLEIWWQTLSGELSDKLVDEIYQQVQGFIAISRGGFFGTGVGESQQKYVLPEAFSDYIFAIINEEYGSLVGILILIAYLTIFFRGMSIATNAKNSFGGLMAIGLSFGLVLQALVNMAVVVGLGPITGLPLPLLSMGGTSLLFTGLSIGIILSVSRANNITSSDTNEEIHNERKQGLQGHH
ncbi:MAG: FtsW/RodA/SpoVE family cell cycle protein [Cytophagales bacterium]|nr:FtsW/RodA/SpoVE family cell cycle protein [Cytophagales bacterium]